MFRTFLILVSFVLGGCTTIVQQPQQNGTAPVVSVDGNRVACNLTNTIIGGVAGLLIGNNSRSSGIGAGLGLALGNCTPHINQQVSSGILVPAHGCKEAGYVPIFRAGRPDCKNPQYALDADEVLAYRRVGQQQVVVVREVQHDANIRIIAPPTSWTRTQQLPAGTVCGRDPSTVGTFSPTVHIPGTDCRRPQ